MHSFSSLKPRDYKQTILCKLIDLNTILDKFKNKILEEGEKQNIYTQPKLQY